MGGGVGRQGKFVANDILLFFFFFFFFQTKQVWKFLVNEMSRFLSLSFVLKMLSVVDQSPRCSSDPSSYF